MLLPMSMTSTSKKKFAAKENDVFIPSEKFLKSKRSGYSSVSRNRNYLFRGLGLGLVI